MDKNFDRIEQLMKPRSPRDIRRDFSDSDDGRIAEEQNRHQRITKREQEAKVIRMKLRKPIQMMGEGREPIPRDEIQRAKMNRIDTAFHDDINNRLRIVSSIKDYRRYFGLQGGKIVGEKEFNEIADLEDECIVKMREHTYDN